MIYKLTIDASSRQDALEFMGEVTDKLDIVSFERVAEKRYVVTIDLDMEVSYEKPVFEALLNQMMFSKNHVVSWQRRAYE